MDEDYFKFCINCGWNDHDYGCTVRLDEAVYQCDLYRFYHPDEVQEFEEWVRSCL